LYHRSSHRKYSERHSNAARQQPVFTLEERQLPLMRLPGTAPMEGVAKLPGGVTVIKFDAANKIERKEQ
jgi:hypothetical protein